MRYRWYARYDIDQDPWEDTIEGMVEAATDDEAIRLVRSGVARPELGTFDEFAWDVWVESSRESETTGATMTWGTT